MINGIEKEPQVFNLGLFMFIQYYQPIKEYLWIIKKWSKVARITGDFNSREFVILRP